MTCMFPSLKGSVRLQNFVVCIITQHDTDRLIGKIASGSHCQHSSTLTNIPHSFFREEQLVSVLIIHLLQQGTQIAATAHHDDPVNIGKSNPRLTDSFLQTVHRHRDLRVYNIRKPVIFQCFTAGTINSIVIDGNRGGIIIAQHALCTFSTNPHHILGTGRHIGKRHLDTFFTGYFCVNSRGDFIINIVTGNIPADCC